MSADTQQPESTTRLQGKALILARAGWAIFAAICLSLWTPAVILYGGIFFQPGLPWSQGSEYAEIIPASIPFWWILHFLLYAILAVFIFWRKSDDRMALLASATLLAIGTSAESGKILGFLQER